MEDVLLTSQITDHARFQSLLFVRTDGWWPMIAIMSVLSMLVYQISCTFPLESLFVLLKDFSPQKAYVLWSIVITWDAFLFSEIAVRFSLRGRYTEKLTRLKKIASNEVSSSGCCCGILQLCNVCKWSWGGLNGTTIHQYLGNIEQKFALLKSYNFTTSREPNLHSFFSCRTDISIKRSENLWYTV